MTQCFDVIIVGAGIVGLSTAQELCRRNPSLSIAILEKESRPGMHASGRNSGVMHCGIYYGADTLKAKVCAEGAQRMGEYATEHSIAYRQSGKLVLATDEGQLPMVERLLVNARDNGIRAEKISAQEAQKIEPHAARGVAAIYCPDTAVIDSAAVIVTLVKQLQAQGVTFRYDTRVVRVNAAAKMLHTPHGPVAYGYLINCAGAFADTLAQQFGLARDYMLVPFKGIYWKLSAEASANVRANIYPVPDPALPFLGVHFTRVIAGDVYLGPTAIPALGRENYHGLAGIRLLEGPRILAMLGRMYARNENNFRRLSHNELGKYSKRRFLLTAQKLMPSLTIEDMVPTKKAGIRPQLVNLKTRKLEMDYIFESTPDSLHVLNTISPAFTSAFAFARMIVDRTGLA